MSSGEGLPVRAEHLPGLDASVLLSPAVDGRGGGGLFAAERLVVLDQT